MFCRKRGLRRIVLTVLIAVLTTGLAPVASAAEDHPDTTAVIDWHMAPLSVDANDDGAIDAYLGGNRSADVPADGRYRVILDGCASAGAFYFEWTVGDQISRSTQCRTAVRLTEGDYHARLRVWGWSGSSVATHRISVVTHIVLGLGDSYGSGAGAAVSTDYPAGAGYFDVACVRTPRSHQAQAALELERSDPKSAVILIHLACAGAQISPGLLSPFQDSFQDYRRPQVDDARALLAGQPADAVLLSIGGNDVGFAVFLERCLLAEGIDCPTAPVGGYPTMHEYLMSTFNVLRNGTAADPLEGLPALAKCLGSVGCTTSETPDGSGTPLGVNPRNVLHTTYPDLTKGDDATYCRAVPNSLDPGLRNATREDWRWTDHVLEALVNEEEFVYTGSSGVQTTLEQTQPGLNAIISETEDRYGWSPVTEVYSGSTGHGYCASAYRPGTERGRWILRFREPTIPPPLLVPVHPNLGGQHHYTREVIKKLDPLLN